MPASRCRAGRGNRSVHLPVTRRPVIILFGSYARGDFTANSDLDLLIILSEVQDTFEEMLRLERVLLSLPLPVDLLVYSTNDVRERAHLRGTALYHALTQGKVLYDAA